MQRRHWLGILYVMLALGMTGNVAQVRAAGGGNWGTAGILGEPRSLHSAALLPDGEVLIMSGFNFAAGQATPTSERYDPTTNGWRPAAAMATARVRHATVTLADGRVLVTGGATTHTFPPTTGTLYASAEIYDPATDRWVAAAPMGTPRAFHSATLLRDGRVLVVGGTTHLYQDFASTDTTAEIYDPQANTWTAVASARQGHAGHPAVLLTDGQVLIIGGWFSGDVLGFGHAVERYDPVTNSWSTARSTLAYRASSTAILLADGRVLIAGGPGALLPAEVAERYDPRTDTWEMTTNLDNTLTPSTLTRLPNGLILGTGGFDYTQPGTHGLAALYNPRTNAWSALPSMRDFRSGQTATLLTSGRVLIAGGGDAEAELFTPDLPQFSDVPPSHPQYRAITDLAAHGIINGYGDGTFGPDDTTLRAQLAALNVRAMGWSAEAPSNPFTDQCDPSGNCVDPELWNTVAILANKHVPLPTGATGGPLTVAKGYTDAPTCGGSAHTPCYAPRDTILQGQSILVISRALIAHGYWTLAADDPSIFPDRNGTTAAELLDHRALVTYVANAGLPPAVADARAGWSGFTQVSTRAWVAQALWQALTSPLGPGLDR